MNIYVCEICHHANGAYRLHCSACGTTPAAYSMSGQDECFHFEGLHWWTVPIVAAHGAERAESRRGRKVYFRTVPLDYYAN